MERKVDIKNLRISFRTNSGTVKAVRNINLELNKGETLAIVGESGSGKSVTARAMIGILAPNAIVESGEILYDGKDLLKISEEEFHEYRGNKISMIFQDPMSSLNPIMKIGKQLTEAMILNGKANQRSAKKELNVKMNQLKEAMIKALAVNGNEAQVKKEIENKIAIFKKFTAAGNELEKAYNTAFQAANEILTQMDILLSEIRKAEPEDVKEQLRDILEECENVYQPFVVADGTKMPELTKELKTALKVYTDSGKARAVIALLEQIQAILKEAVAKTAPNFFRMGYDVTYNKNADINGKDVEALNKEMRKYLDENFMLDFIEDAKAGIQYSFQKALNAKQSVVNRLEAAKPVFTTEKLDEKECRKTAKELIACVEESIDRLAIYKDSLAYTFKSSIESELDRYFKAIVNNVKEEKRFEQESKAVEKAVKAGKPTGTAIPPVIIDLELVKENILRIITRLQESYEQQMREALSVDFDALAVGMIDYLKDRASAMVHKVTKKMAKLKAIKLMEEVGIPQPRKRYNQYPFQFSGGMRQRIVIAIALAANPDILICDEPTTALDVTIQSQILELINRLKEERNLSVVFITHDLGVVANMADRIAVMYAGKIVEYGTVDDIFYQPAHPYTWALLSSMPDLDTKETLEAIPGTPPNMIYPPKGDAFAARNKYAMQIDFEEEPPLFEISDTHSAATWLLHPAAPKVEMPKVVKDRIERMKRLEVAADA